MIALAIAARSRGFSTGSSHGWPTTWPIACSLDMRLDMFRKLDALAPAYLSRRRTGISSGWPRTTSS